MHNQERTDHELLARFRKGRDTDALGTFFLRYMDLIYGVCLKYLGQPELARDAVMDIYEHLNRKLPDQQIDHPGAWLYTVAKNHCLGQLRRKNKLLTLSLDDPDVQNGHELHQEGDWPDLDHIPDHEDLLHECIGALPDHQSVCIRMFYFEKKSYADITTAAGMTGEQVRSNIQNGRRNLKRCLEQKINRGAGNSI